MNLGWNLDPSITFLNHGSFGACPEAVLARQRALRDRMEAEPVRFLDLDLPGLLDEARAEIGRFLGADLEGLAFVPNATAGVNTILQSLRFEPGDELLANDHEYNATLNALATVAERARGRVVRVSIPLPIRHPEEVVEAILAGVTPRTRVALISHVTSVSGLVFPIETIVRELDRLGVDTLVDAAHAPGQVPVDVGVLGAAYWTGNGHKWLCGPKGAGVLHVREDRRAGVLPLVTSHGRNDPRSDRPTLWKEFDWQGTGNPTPFLALPDAIQLIGSLQSGGWPAHMAVNRALVLAGRDLINERLGLEPIAPDSMVGSMAALALPIAPDEATTDALSTSLAAEDHIEVPVGPFPVRAAREPGAAPSAALLRLSAQRYNEPEDYERLADALVRRGLARTVTSSASAIVAG